MLNTAAKVWLSLTKKKKKGIFFYVTAMTIIGEVFSADSGCFFAYTSFFTR